MSSSANSNANHRRQWAAWLYRLATLPQRRKLREELIRTEQMPIAVLFYHRVADRNPTEWTISRRNFMQQLDWLQGNFDIVSLEEAQRRIRNRTNKRPTVAITFDDGYSDNCEFAMPELARRGLPATYFVATEPIATRTLFAHDARCRHDLRPNTIDEIREIAAQGFEIAAHTRNHIDLARVRTREQLVDEIQGSIEDLKSWNVGPVRYFSFPFGMPENTSQTAVDVLLEAGIEGFCTAYGAWNWPGNPGYHLRRIHADPGMQTLKSWLTLDPRKLIDRSELPFLEPNWQIARRTAEFEYAVQ